MLNIKELREQFYAILATQTEADLLAWIAFDEERQIMDQLKEGSKVWIKSNIKISVPATPNNLFLIVDDHYANAA